MSKIFSRIAWERGVWVYQRIPMQAHGILPENFEVRPFTIQRVVKFHSDDFPLEHLRDLAEYNDWLNQNLAENIGDGIFYIMVYGRNWQRWYGKRRVYKSFKGTKGIKVRRYYGLISLDKFEIKNGQVERHFKTRGFRKIPPRNKRPVYPVWSLFNVT